MAKTNEPKKIYISRVEGIWNRIAWEPKALQLSDEQRMELDRRLDAYHNDPAHGSPWEIVRQRIKNRK